MDTSGLTKDIDAAATAGSLGTLEENQRVDLLAACEKLKATLESPLEATLRIAFGAHQAVVLRLAIDLKIFDVVARTFTSGGSMQISQLATKTGAESQLMSRIMKILAGMGLFQEIGVDTYLPTPLARNYVTDHPYKEIVVHFSVLLQTMSRLPNYFEQNGYKNPMDAFNGPFQFAMETKLHCFDWLKTKPRYQHAFNTVMGISRIRNGEEWFEYYPVEQNLQVASPADPLLIDIGGGLGHGLDLPIVIDEVKGLPPRLEVMGHDFFTPQPIKGAKAYYLRAVLHDWPDQQAKQILESIRAAMCKDSRLLIDEAVIPEFNVSLHSALLDFSMMTMFSSLDRTQTQFVELLDSSGFELIKVWTPKVVVPGSGSLIEAVLKEELAHASLE